MEETFPTDDDGFRYVIGIDLGTTNSALSWVDRTASETEVRRIHSFDVPQLTAPSEVARRSVLPSFLYLPGPFELPGENIRLPWAERRDRRAGCCC